MAKKNSKDESVVSTQSSLAEQLREPAEVRYADQLEALRQNDQDAKPRSYGQPR